MLRFTAAADHNSVRPVQRRINAEAHIAHAVRIVWRSITAAPRSAVIRFKVLCVSEAQTVNKGKKHREVLKF